MYQSSDYFISLTCALIVSLSYHPAVFCEDQPETGSRSASIGIFPFAPLGIDNEDAETVAKLIQNKIDVEALFFEHDQIMDALDEADCDDEEKWGDKDCVREAGAKLGADYIVAGSIGKVGESVFADVFLFDVAKSTVIWNNQYKEKGTIDEFTQSSVQAIADGIKANLPETVKHTEAQNIPEAETYEEAPSKRKIQTTDNGIAKGISIGVKGLFALGSVKDAQYTDRAQSPAGFMLFSLFPLTPATQLRVRAGIPIWHVNGTFITEPEYEYDYRTEVKVEKDFPDPYFSVEHAWGWEKIGFSLGLAYMFLQQYSRDILEYYSPSLDTSHYHYEYDRNHFFNVVCSVRGGRTRGGFFGMVSFPLAVTLNRGRTDYVVEYSLFGAFGIKKTKIGIGHMGMIKKRESDSTDINGTGYANDYYSREMYLLFPCLKVAQLIGEHLVLNFTFELGGTIIPRFGGEMDNWRPSIGLDVMYSFGKLGGPNVMDGTF